MAAFEKGHEKLGGRKKGARNKVTVEIKELLNTMLPPERLEKLWNDKLNHEDPHISIKALEMALHYMFGKPVQPVIGEELAPPIKIDISAIPQHRKRVTL